jgi:hypothetical protein
MHQAVSLCLCGELSFSYTHLLTAMKKLPSVLFTSEHMRPCSCAEGRGEGVERRLYLFKARGPLKESCEAGRHV